MSTSNSKPVVNKVRVVSILHNDIVSVIMIFSWISMADQFSLGFSHGNRKKKVYLYIVRGK